MPTTPDHLFILANILAVCGWLPLFFAPRWTGTARLATAAAVPMLLSAIYLAIVITGLVRGGGDGGFFSLADIQTLFADPLTLTAGWIHYLAFDLVVGGLIHADARRLQVPHALVVPCLALTLWVGPIGFLAWRLLRRSRTGAWLDGSGTDAAAAL